MSTNAAPTVPMQTPYSPAEMLTATFADTLSVLVLPFRIKSVPVNNCEVLTRFGRIHSIKQPGLRFFPFATQTWELYLGMRTYSTPELIVPEANGKPVSVKCILNYKITEPDVFVAQLNANLQYIHSQTEKITKNMISKFTYDELRSSPEVSKMLVDEINNSVRKYGITAVNYDITDVQYEKTVAGSLLAEQQAHAIGKAKTTLVSTCTGIVVDTIKELETKGITFTQAEKSKFASNLMISLTAGRVDAVVPLV